MIRPPTCLSAALCDGRSGLAQLLIVTRPRDRLLTERPSPFQAIDIRDTTRTLAGWAAVVIVVPASFAARGCPVHNRLLGGVAVGHVLRCVDVRPSIPVCRPALAAHYIIQITRWRLGPRGRGVAAMLPIVGLGGRRRSRGCTSRRGVVGGTAHLGREVRVLAW